MSIVSTFLSFITILFSVFVIFVVNPIVSVVYLISLFVAVSCSLIIQGINFIGISYIIVYVGAILVIFLFVILLFDLKQLITLQSNNIYNNLLLSILISSLFGLFLIINILPEATNYNYLLQYDLNTFNSTQDVIEILSPIQQIKSIGLELYTSYGLLLFIISIILLLAMLAVIFLK